MLPRGTALVSPGEVANSDQRLGVTTRSHATSHVSLRSSCAAEGCVAAAGDEEPRTAGLVVGTWDLTRSRLGFAESAGFDDAGGALERLSLDHVRAARDPRPGHAL